jgi:cytochrome P450 PksS
MPAPQMLDHAAGDVSTAHTPRPSLIAPDLASPEFKADPYPFYARLREEAPVFPVTVRVPDRRRAWLITRYDDVVAALKDSRLVKDRRNVVTNGHRARESWMPGFLRPLERNMLDLDEPDHTRLRTLVHHGFTPRLVERLRDRVQSVAERLLDSAQREGQLDLVAGYALPIPATIIAELLGVPPEDQRRFHNWSKGIVTASTTSDFLIAIPSIYLFMRYLRSLLARRRAAPRDDLISALIQAEEAGDRLSPDELLAMVVLLLIAGHETTVNLIASGTLALLRHPDQLERLRSDPALMPTAVEELLRFTSPVEIATERYACEPLEIAGTTIPAGDLVLAVLGSANRDPQHFAAPDTLDLAREPNRHLAFGQGVHYCLGAPLARLEGQIAFETLLRRLPGLRLAVPPEAVRWRRGLFLRGPQSLPIAWKEAVAAQRAALRLFAS